MELHLSFPLLPQIGEEATQRITTERRKKKRDQILSPWSELVPTCVQIFRTLSLNFTVSPTLGGQHPYFQLFLAKERAIRERLRDLFVFERLNGNPAKTSPNIAVKKVKFHIVSHQKLARCCGESYISSLHQLNMEQLLKCLLSLFDIYVMNRTSKSVSNNEAEFYSFYVLLRLSWGLTPFVVSSTTFSSSSFRGDALL
ncbi:SAC3 family protein C isoform X1 [Iris pallida]|uniref:SAC3 family protein C isoform X1 n=1 Tax=Iris pallida TaxID=29817 RepID=A0AAX6FRH5_IRIPA|nr:SAC3 family protein C isoform X1 [Iris pallida]